MTSHKPRPSEAFSRLKVIDASENISGPFCGKMFAALGAEVIKVESPRSGDPIRRAGPFPHDVPDQGKGGLYSFLNMGKKGVTLDSRGARGRELLARLLQDADVLIDSATPEKRDVTGLSYEALRQVNPRLVMASVTPFGQTGPYKDYKASELVLRAMSGEMYLAGKPDRPPLMKGGHLAQFHGGLHTFLSVMAALLYRDALGRGQYIDVSQAEGWASICGMFLKSYTYSKRVPIRTGGSNSFPGGLRRCKDGWVMISGRGGRRSWWPRFVNMLNLEVLRESRFDTSEGRDENREILDTVLGYWLAQHTKEDVYHEAQGYGLASAYVCGAEDLLQSPQLRSRGYFEHVEGSPVGDVPFPARPFLMSGISWQNTRAPRLGEHNQEVFCHLLGLTRQELDSLRSQGVI